MDAARDLDRPREGLWIARPQKPRWVAPALLCMGLIQAPNALRLVVRSIGGETASWSFLLSTVVAASLVPLTWALWERRTRRTRARDLALMDGAFGDQFPAEVAVLAEGQRLGTDRGVLWFADGLMGFSGAASSFVLAAADLSVPILSNPEASGPDAKTKTHPVVAVLRNAPREAQMTIAPLIGHEAAFRARLAAFVAADEPPGGERFWPPLVPYRAFEETTPALD